MYAIMQARKEGLGSQGRALRIDGRWERERDRPAYSDRQRTAEVKSWRSAREHRVASMLDRRPAESTYAEGTV